MVSPNVCLILRSFAPRNESGSLRCTAFAKHLPTMGFDVSVFCAAPDVSNRLAGTAAHVAQNWVDDPAWKIVTRVEWPQSNGSSSALRRFPIGSSIVGRRRFRERVDALYPRLKQHIKESRPNLLFASCAPPETLMLAQRAAAEFRIPYITDLRDPWSTVAGSPYRHVLDYLLGRQLETRIHQGAAHIVVASSRSKDLLVEEHGLDPDRITFIANGYVEEELADVSLPANIPSDKFVIVHSGELNHGVRTNRFSVIKKTLGLDFDPLKADLSSRSPVPIMNALNRLFTESQTLREKIIVAFTGLHLDRLPTAITEFPFQDNLRLFGRIASEEAHGIMRRGDLLLLMASNYFYRGREFCCTIPAKTYSYIRTGNPILAATISSELKGLLADFPQANFVAPDNIEGLAAAIRDAVGSWTPSASKEDESLPPSPPKVQQYSRESGAQQLGELIQKVLGNS